MAADAPKAAPPTQNGTHSDASAPSKPIELAISLPSSPGTRIHIHLTVLAATTLLFLTSASLEAGTSAAANLGSFVMGMPDVRPTALPQPCTHQASMDVLTMHAVQRYNPSNPLSTALYTLPSSLDFTTRMAKLLARRTGLPCYVGSSVDLSAAAGDGSVEEEMAAFRAVVDVVTGEVEKARSGGT